VAISVTDQIQASLLASRNEADRIVDHARDEAGELTALAGEADRALAAARIARLRDLRRQIQAQQQRIDAAYAAMAEALAVSSLKLAQAARDADFSSPAWPAGIRQTVEIRMAETREVTFRIETGATGAGNASGPQV